MGHAGAASGPCGPVRGGTSGPAGRRRGRLRRRTSGLAAVDRRALQGGDGKVYTQHDMAPSPDRPNGAPALGFARITHDPAVMGGRACLRGLRITVALVVNLVANGMSVEEILREYPDLEREDVWEALRYAAFLASEEIHPLVAGAP